MANCIAKMSVLCVAVLVLSGVTSAQGPEFDLILEKTFASPTEQVGIDYDGSGRPIFTLVSEDRVGVMDHEGNIHTIVSGLTESDWASPSDNGRFVGVLYSTEALDSISGQPYFEYHFTLKRRNGETAYEILDCPFNSFSVGNDGSVLGTARVSIMSVVEWQYYDQTGDLGRTFRASRGIPFGDSGSYLVHHRDTVSAYTRDHTPLWSLGLSSRAIGSETSKVSDDGRYFVRCSLEATRFYRDGSLVKTDTIVAGPWNSVEMTPDGSHALVVSTQKAYLWDLDETTLVRTYATDPNQGFQDAASSSEGLWVVFYTSTQDTSAPSQRLISLYDANAEIVWGADAPPEDESIPWVDWLTIDPTGTYISQRDYTKLWLYKRR